MKLICKIYWRRGCLEVLQVNNEAKVNQDHSKWCFISVRPILIKKQSTFFVAHNVMFQIRGFYIFNLCISMCQINQEGPFWAISYY